MAYFIGIDGGGTKTAFVLGTETGTVLEETELTGCSYRQLGLDGAVDLLENGVMALLDAQNLGRGQVQGMVIGLPCYGENAQIDREVEMLLKQRLGPIPLFLTNDVVVGWAGSLELKPGIHVVAGTGAIAYGENAQGDQARCGGWDEFFSDEGSCYWLGRRMMELFSKEADGRIPKGPLYDLVRQRFALSDDYQFIEKVIPKISSRREAVAKLQILLGQAARAGDKAALEAYLSAAEELALVAAGVKHRLHLADGCPVSYSGGLFQADDLILPPLRRELERQGCRMVKPSLPPSRGALLMARRKFSPGDGSGNCLPGAEESEE